MSKAVLQHGSSDSCFNLAHKAEKLYSHVVKFIRMHKN